MAIKLSSLKQANGVPVAPPRREPTYNEKAKQAISETTVEDATVAVPVVDESVDEVDVDLEEVEQSESWDDEYDDEEYEEYEDEYGEDEAIDIEALKEEVIANGGAKSLDEFDDSWGESIMSLLTDDSDDDDYYEEEPHDSISPSNPAEEYFSVEPPPQPKTVASPADDEEEDDEELLNDEEDEDEEYAEDYEEEYEVPDVEDVPRDEEGTLIIADEEGNYQPWAEDFLLSLPKIDALSLDDEDYEWWERLHTDSEDPEGTSEGFEDEEWVDEGEDEESTPEEPLSHEQVGIDESVEGAKESKFNFKEIALNVLDGIAGFLSKFVKIPILGRLFKGVIPGTPSGRGAAGVAIAILLFAVGSIINQQIVGNKLFEATGTTKAEIVDGGHVTLDGIKREDGKYYAVVKNDGDINAYSIIGSVHMTGSEAYSMPWSDSKDFGTCTFAIDDVPAGEEGKAPLTCDSNTDGLGSVTFTDATLHSEEV
jgi:midasin, putative